MIDENVGIETISDPEFLGTNDQSNGEEEANLVLDFFGSFVHTLLFPGL